VGVAKWALIRNTCDDATSHFLIPQNLEFGELRVRGEASQGKVVLVFGSKIL
jgi:hypothetical protein